MPSAQQKAAVVEEYLGQEFAESRMIGQLDPNVWPGIHVNPFESFQNLPPGKITHYYPAWQCQ